MAALPENWQQQTVNTDLVPRWGGNGERDSQGNLPNQSANPEGYEEYPAASRQRGKIINTEGYDDYPAQHQRGKIINTVDTTNYMAPVARQDLMIESLW